MQDLNASLVDLVAGGKSGIPSAEPPPPPLLAPRPRPWPWYPVEP